MSNDTPPNTLGYTLRVHIDETRHWDCNLCGASSHDLDAARAHHAVHVAGPELLDALKGARETIAGDGYGTEDEDAAIMKAEPKG